jgi:hypothetical protein
MPCVMCFMCFMCTVCMYRAASKDRRQHWCFGKIDRFSCCHRLPLPPPTTKRRNMRVGREANPHSSTVPISHNTVQYCYSSHILHYSRETSMYRTVRCTKYEVRQVYRVEYFRAFSSIIHTVVDSRVRWSLLTLPVDSARTVYFDDIAEIEGLP